MPQNYRYVAQGEFFITKDPDTVLLTSGMTECIAIAFIDKNNHATRLLTHFDGMILYDVDTARKNVACLIANYPSKDFDIFLLGGQEKLRNCKILFTVFKEFNLEITHFEDANNFCKRINFEKNAKPSTAISPSSADMTMICASDTPPLYVCYTQKLLNGFSDDDLIAGKGLISPEEQKQYYRFFKINDQINSRFPDEAKALRHCSDLEFIKTMEQRISEKHLNKLSVFSAPPSIESRRTPSQDPNTDDFSAFDFMDSNEP